MTDSMKFGPEWLRNMGQDGCTAPTPTPRYQLAEHRYGREEMLALFDRVVKAPDPLASLPGLYVDKTQIPLALIQMTEEETRHWNRGINSDAVLRAVGKTPPLPLNPSVRGSRGAPILSVGLSERGRGRGRGGFTTYSRGLSYEETGDIPSGPPHGHLGAPPGGYTRGTRPFDRPQGERSWGERNGLDSTDWSSTSPRKDFNERDRGLGLTASTRSFSNTDSNWRRHRSEDEDGWRTLGTPVKEKWCGAGASGAARTTSWREGDRDREKDGDRDLEGRGSYTRPHRSWDHSNNLPEWAVDGADNSGGSFDAQGAFHGGQNYSDDEEGGMVNNNALRRTRLLSEGNSVGSPVKKEGNINLHVRRVVATDRASAERVSEKLTPYLDKQNDRVPSPFSPPRNEEPKSQDSTPVKSVPNSKSDPALKPKEFTSPSPSRIVLVKNEPELSQKQLEHPNALATSASMPAMPINAAVENSIDTRQKQVIHEHKSEDAMERMREVADDLVAKLMEEEERPMREDITHRPLPHLGSHAREPEKWFYRDPQGQVQGPFSSEEMAEWWRLGYFTLNLLVRRAKDERFSPLQDLIKIFGDIPFLTDSNVPPVKGTEPLLMPTPGVGLPIGPTLPKLPMSGLPGMPGLPGVPGVPVVPGVEPDIQIMMQHQFQVMQQQMFLRQQQSQAAAAAAAVSKLSQTEGWATLSPMEQQQLVGQHIQMNAHLAMDGVPPLLPSASAPNPVVALMSQYQQKPQQQSCAPSNNDASGQKPGQSLDPLQQLIQQMGGLSSRLSPPLASPQPSQSANDPLPSDPIQSLLRQLGQQQQHQQHQQHHQSMDDSLWGNRHYTSIGWLGGVRPPLVGGSVPPSGPMLPPSTASLWGDLNAKEMKTEKQILVEQMRLEEERKKQELLQKQEEEEQQRRLEEEARQRREAEEAAAEAEKRRKKAEESRRKEEESKRKEDQRKAEEEQRKKLEEAKRQEIAKKKDEDKRRKEDEKKKKEEDKERKKREEEEKKRLEEERHQRQREAEEQAKRAEQQRQQAEALKKMQEQQQKQAQAAAVIKTAKIAPWSQPQAVKASGQSASLSLAEIQRNQKREKEEQLREQQMILQQIQQQNQQNQLSAMLASSLAAAENQAQPAPMQLKWAERKPAPLPEAKTLEQIQREEHERVAKQMERDRAERAERAASARDAPAPSVGIWGSAPQSLTWGSGPGFWDEVASPVVSPVKPSAQTLKKNTPVKSASASNVSAAAQQSSKTTNSSAKKKKEEATVLKLFEQTVQRTDEFSQWCHKALASLQPSVDIPTFVGFLRDIESPYEVKDYVRQYLGEGEGANDFARQFLERRSKWRSERRSKPAADDMCAPAPAVNPATQPTSHDFQEVKSKGKKAKKGKMYKVDKSILGFSVTAAPDRINVGDRDYGEGM